MLQRLGGGRMQGFLWLLETSAALSDMDSLVAQPFVGMEGLCRMCFKPIARFKVKMNV